MKLTVMVQKYQIYIKVSMYQSHKHVSILTPCLRKTLHWSQLGYGRIVSGLKLERKEIHQAIIKLLDKRDKDKRFIRKLATYFSPQRRHKNYFKISCKSLLSCPPYYHFIRSDCSGFHTGSLAHWYSEFPNFPNPKQPNILNFKGKNIFCRNTPRKTSQFCW